MGALGGFLWDILVILHYHTHLCYVGEQLAQQSNGSLVPIGYQLILIFGAKCQDIDFLQGKNTDINSIKCIARYVSQVPLKYKHTQTNRGPKLNRKWASKTQRLLPTSNSSNNNIDTRDNGDNRDSTDNNWRTFTLYSEAMSRWSRRVFLWLAASWNHVSSPRTLQNQTSKLQ